MTNKTFTIPVSDLFEESFKACIDYGKIQTDSNRGQKLLAKCMEVRERYCSHLSVKLIWAPFFADCVHQDHFKLENKIIRCNELKNINSLKMIGGYLYTVFLDPVNYESMSTLESYYTDCWMSAYTDTAWNRLKTMLVCEGRKDFALENYSDPITVSDSFAPGFGMEMESVCDLYELMSLSDYGMTLQEQYCLMPSKSIIGIYLLY